MKIQIINGPNLNLLGKREPDIYGNQSLEDINKIVSQHCDHKNIQVTFFQSNVEGEIVNEIQKLIDKKFDGLIINAAAFTHTSVAILDALNIIKFQKSKYTCQIFTEEKNLGKKSLISKAVDGIICGFGVESYIYAIDAMSKIIKNGIR